MRDMKTLLQLLLENFRRQGFLGICVAIGDMLSQNQITDEEYDALLSYFKSQKPENDFIFTKHPAWRGGAWWWSFIGGGNEQRILFLEHLISKQDETETL